MSGSIHRASIALAALVLAPAPVLAQPAPTFAQQSAAAADVVRSYYEALAARDFRRAYGLWANAGAASGKSFADFERGFAQTRSTSVRIVAAGDPDIGAGQIGVTVTVEVRATLGNGAQQKFAGNYVVGRANDVSGANVDQLTWHIRSASLRPAS
jgi:hypothetical protein